MWPFRKKLKTRYMYYCNYRNYDNKIEPSAKVYLYGIKEPVGHVVSWQHMSGNHSDRILVTIIYDTKDGREPKEMQLYQQCTYLRPQLYLQGGSVYVDFERRFQWEERQLTFDYS